MEENQLRMNSVPQTLLASFLEIIDFMPLSTVDYSGGIIITDWYSDSNNFNESIKITVRFLSNEIASNSIKIIVHNKKCKTTENCTVNEIDSKIKLELQRTILAKAAQYEIEQKNQRNKLFQKWKDITFKKLRKNGVKKKEATSVTRKKNQKKNIIV